MLASPLDIGIDAIKQALGSVQLAGRFDYRQLADRHWLFDVAHNEHGVDFMLAQLAALWQQHKQLAGIAGNKTATIKVVFSMLADKDIELVVQRLTQADLPMSEWFIAEIDYPRAASVEQLIN